jgi:hypothetical protein
MIASVMDLDVIGAVGVTQTTLVTKPRVGIF